MTKNVKANYTKHQQVFPYSSSPFKKTSSSINASLYLNYQVFSYVLMETSIQQSVFNKTMNE